MSTFAEKIQYRMQEEKKIIELLQQRDPHCMYLLFKLYYKPLCIYALKYLPSFEDAEDIVQEIYTSFWDKKQGTLFTGSLCSYFFGSVRKACIEYARLHNRIVWIEPTAQYTDFSEETEFFLQEEQELRHRQLKEALDRLPEKCRLVFIAIVLDNLQYKEVAEMMHISINTVKTQYARALKLLRNMLDHIIFTLLLPYFKK